MTSAARPELVPSSSAVSILLVDEQPERLRALGDVLAPLGQRLVRVSSEEEAGEQAQREDFAAVLLSTGERRGGPADALVRLQERALGRQLPILVLADSLTDEQQVLEAYAAGAVDCLPRSLSPELLRARVSSLVNLWRRGEARRQLQQQGRLEAEAEREKFYALLMQAPAAVVVYHGPEFVVEFINPLCREILGNRPQVGRPIAETAPELKGTVAYEALNTVYTCGEPFIGREVLVPLRRGPGGGLQDCYFNFVIQPTRDLNGRTTGVVVFAVEVTDQVVARHRVESLAEGLRRSEERFRSLVAATASVVWSTNPAGEVLEDSPSWRAFTGQSPEEWMGNGWLNAVHPEDRARAGAAWREAIRSKGLFEVDYRLRRHDGSWAHTVVRGMPISGPDGAIREWVGCIIDVTRLRQAEEALRAQSRMTRAITDNATLGLLMMDANQRCTFMNPAAERITGLSFAQVQALDKPLHDIIHHTRPDGRPFPMAECPIDRALPTKAQEQGEDIFVRPDGSFYPVAFTASPLVEDGVPIGTVIEVRDITERKRNETALLRSEARFRLATRATNDVIWDWDLTTNELLWNEGLETTFGYPHQSVPKVADWWYEHIHPEDRDRVLKDIHAVIDGGGKYWRDEYRFSRSDGSFALVTDRGYIEHDARGRPMRMVGAMQDITERHLTEQRLREQSETLKTLNQLGSVLAAELDMEKLVQAVTDAATRLSGAQFGSFFYNVVDARGEILTLYTLSGVPREAFSSFPMPRNTAVFNPTFTGQGVVRVDDITKDPRYGKNPPYNGKPKGHLPVVSYLAVPVISRLGKVVGGLFFGHHLPGVFTERAEQLVVGIAAQAAVAMDNARLFQEAQRLIKALERSNAELDQFAYVASHDLKAPLRGIANLSQWIEEDLGAAMTPETHEQMNLLRGRVHRLEGLIDGILQYSRAGRVRAKAEPVEVGRLLKDVLELLSPPPGTRVELPPELPTLHTERVPLQQVFLNLLSNALKHSRREDPHVMVGARAVADGYEFSVGDNGPGIAPEYHERIWGIFQTLERRDKVEGTGIGLSVVKKIVESRGGRAWVESTEGSGATFSFFWPNNPRGE